MFIAVGSAEQFRDAVLNCCTMWGGITNLIIPLKANLRIQPIYEYLLGVHEPDVAISYLSTSSTNGRKRHDQLRVRLDELSGSNVPLHAAEFDGADLGCHVLSVIRDEDLGSRQFLASQLHASTKSEELALLALMGEVHPGQESEYARLTRLGTNPMSYTDLRFWNSQTAGDPFASPINLTSYGYGPYEVVAGSFGNEVFEIVLGEDIDSLCYFWNLRATRIAGGIFGDPVRRVLLAPPKLIADQEAVGRLADTIRAIGLGEGVDSEVELLVYSRDSDLVERFDEVAQSADRFRRHTDSFQLSRTFAGSIAPEPKAGPVTWATTLPSLPESFKYGVSYEGHELVVFEPGPTNVRIARSARYENRLGQHVMLDFESDLWSRFPKSPGSARAALDNARWTRHGLSMAGTIPRHPSYVTVTVPDEIEVLRHFFADRNFDIRETKLSGYVDAVVHLLGGYSQLQLLGSPCAYQLIDALATKSTLKVAQKLKVALGATELTEGAILDRLREAGVSLDLAVSRTADELKTQEPLRPFARNVLPTLTTLTACGAVRRGISLECSTCGSPGWHPIDSLGEQVHCTGCGERQAVPAEYPEGSGEEIPWSYVLNSLVNRAWDQDLGPVLVTMSHVARDGNEVTCRGAGIEVIQGSKIIGDLDWIMYRDGRLLAGEAKSGANLGWKDVAFARIMLNAGIDAFYFSTTNTFSKNSRERVVSLTSKSGDELPDVHCLERGELFAP